MKLGSFISALSILATTFGFGVLIQTQPGFTQGRSAQLSLPPTQFQCALSPEGIPTTYAVQEREETLYIPIIRWASDYFARSGFDSTDRCRIVSERFQTFQQQGRLQYLTTGRLNGYPIICVSQNNTGDRRCTEADLLLTLQLDDDPEGILTELVAVGREATGPITRGPLYIPFENILSNSPAETPQLVPAGTGDAPEAEESLTGEPEAPVTSSFPE